MSWADGPEYLHVLSALPLLGMQARIGSVWNPKYESSMDLSSIIAAGTCLEQPPSLPAGMI